MKTPIFVFNSLNVERGGLTKAVMKRANILVNYYEKVVFFTLAFQQEHKQIIEKLYKTGQLDQRVEVRNFYTDMLQISKAEVQEAPINIEGMDAFKDKKHKSPSYRYYRNGLYEQYRRFNGDGSLKLVDYMDESRTRLRREEYLRDGRLVRTRHMDTATNKPKLDRYFIEDGTCKLTVWVNPSGSEGRTMLFGSEGIEFEKIEHAYAYWIERAAEAYKNPVLLSDSRKTDEAVLKVSSSIEKIAVAHNNHFESPYDETAGIKKTWNTFFSGINEFDTVVFLTEEQREDVLRQFNVTTNIAVIPHAASESIQGAVRSYQPHVAVTLARFEHQKQVNEGIAAFKYVVDEIPDAQYHIYGFGPLEEKLKKQIKDLNLGSNVLLKGFSSDPTASYQSGACSVLTSAYEGFGMVLTESLASGTPAVSYDIKYGPKDIIRNGVDGYLVPKGDQKALAARIIELMQDADRRHQMAENGLEVTKRFSEQKYEKAWVELFGEHYTLKGEEQPKKRSFFGFGRNEK